ncbi:MAG: hypothetical protein J7M18_00055, partial [Candidatus Eremiobacteraeota bacterium]|nr:hypothetical protein [Candidatus Eremiobacteraeota bacterium]
MLYSEPEAHMGLCPVKIDIYTRYFNFVRLWRVFLRPGFETERNKIPLRHIVKAKFKNRIFKVNWFSKKAPAEDFGSRKIFFRGITKGGFARAAEKFLPPFPVKFLQRLKFRLLAKKISKKFAILLAFFCVFVEFAVFVVPELNTMGK